MSRLAILNLSFNCSCYKKLIDPFLTVEPVVEHKAQENNQESQVEEIPLDADLAAVLGKDPF